MLRLMLDDTPLLATSEAQDRGLEYARTKFNTENNANLTIEQFIQRKTLEVLGPMFSDYQRAQRVALDTAYAEASEDLKAQVRALLSVNV